MKLKVNFFVSDTAKVLSYERNSKTTKFSYNIEVVFKDFFKRIPFNIRLQSMTAMISNYFSYWNIDAVNFF